MIYSLSHYKTYVQFDKKTVNYRSTKHLTVTTHYNLYSLYLSFYFFYLYNARQQEPQTQSQSQKPKKKKKKKKTQTVQFSRSTSIKSPNQFNYFSSSVKTQTWNTQTPQAQFLWFSESQITDSQGFEIWRKR